MVFFLSVLGFHPQHYWFHYLATFNEEKTRNISHGLVSFCWRSGGFTYKRSRRGNAVIDRARSMFSGTVLPYRVMDFIPYGYDERQFCSPGFNLPVGNLTLVLLRFFSRIPYSADNLDFVLLQHSGNPI